MLCIFVVTSLDMARVGEILKLNTPHRMNGGSRRVVHSALDRRPRMTRLISGDAEWVERQ